MNITSSAKSLVVVAVTFISVALLGQTSSAAPLDHIDHLALRLQGQSRELIKEFQLHYRHTCDYAHLLSDAYKMHRLAAHIHNMVHYGGSSYHVRSDVNELDSLFHHLEDLVGHIEHHPSGGHIHGDTFHVHELLAAVEDTLHHLQEDVRVATYPSYHHGFGRVGIYPGHGHPGYGHSHSGISFGNGRFAIRFKF